MDAFNFGPYIFDHGRAMRVAGIPSQSWTVSYGNHLVAERTIPTPQTRSAVIDALSDQILAFEHHLQDKHAAERISLVEFESDKEIGHFYSFDGCELRPSIIDDRHPHWLRSANGLRARDVTLTEFAQIAAEHAAPKNGWITGTLPDDVLTTDPEDWRAPTSWEIRHIVGEGSFTGVTGAQAAALVGVTPQNFRKYTARDGARTRQTISFAMWHLLLHKLGVQKS